MKCWVKPCRLRRRCKVRHGRLISLYVTLSFPLLRACVVCGTTFCDTGRTGCSALEVLSVACKRLADCWSTVCGNVVLKYVKIRVKKSVFIPRGVRYLLDTVPYSKCLHRHIFFVFQCTTVRCVKLKWLRCRLYPGGYRLCFAWLIDWLKYARMALYVGT